MGFDSRPSTDRDVTGNGNGTNTNPNGPLTGGNSDVIIRINEVPGDTTADNGNTVIDFDVTAPGGSITDVVCQHNGQVMTNGCGPNGNVVIPNTEGEHTFTIIGTDDQGNTAVETVTWVIYNPNNLVERTKNIVVNEVNEKVDIIINVDNSGSMVYEQTSMANRISSFMSRFQHLDYHIAVTTTSPLGGVWSMPHLDYTDGRFVNLGGGQHCIKKSDYKNNIAQAQTLLQQNVVRDLYLRDNSGNAVPIYNGAPCNPNVAANDDSQISFCQPEGNGWERGIFTTYRAFERANVNGSNEAECMRDGVPKHVILISDERETLTDNDGVPLNDQNKSNPTSIRNLVRNVFGSDTLFKFHSIIVNPYSSEGEACLASHGAKSGVEYANLSLATGGVIGSVCAADYGSQLGQIGQTISDSNLTYPLDCIPVEHNGSRGSVTNVPGGTTWSFNGDKVEFSQLLPQGTYTVKYFCLQ